MVRDIFLCGVLNHNLRELFYQEGGDLTVQKMINIVNSCADSLYTTGSDSVKNEPPDDDNQVFHFQVSLSFILTSPGNSGGVIFSLQFVLCLSVNKIPAKRMHRFGNIFFC